MCLLFSNILINLRFIMSAMLVVLSFSGLTPAQNIIPGDTGITRISLKKSGIVLDNNRSVILKDTLQQDETNYYSTLYRIGCSNKSEWTLYIVSTVMDGADKGDNAGLPVRSYLLQNNNNLYYCGNRKQMDGLGGKSPVFMGISRKLNCELKKHSNIILSELEILPEIQLKTGATLYWIPSEVMIGDADKTILKEISKVDTIGPIFITDETKSYLAGNPLDFNSKKLNSWMSSCRDNNCYETNRFFLFRIDGTFLIYDIRPPEVQKNIVFVKKEQHLGFKDYTTKTLTTCEAKSVADVTPLSASFLKRNPLEFSATLSSKDTIWTFKNGAPVLKDAFEILQKGKEYWGEVCGDEYVVKDFQSFVNGIPLFVWKDPFGRMVLYKIKELNPPACCEPVFYLYSPVNVDVDVKLCIPDVVRNSSPAIKTNGWSVTITDNEMYSGQYKDKIPYVFWEGWVGALPEPETGFCVSKDTLETFFDRYLLLCGLNKKEINDFKSVWLTKCPSAPFYTIHFYDTDFANKYCPLEITPKPQALIRVLVDIQPGNIFRPVKRQDLHLTPERTGLVYVEWGAIVRDYNSGTHE